MKHNTMTNYYCFNAYTKVTIITVIIIHVYKCPVNDLILESCLAIFFYVFWGLAWFLVKVPIFQSFWDRAIASWVFTSTLANLLERICPFGFLLLTPFLSVRLLFHLMSWMEGER